MVPAFFVHSSHPELLNKSFGLHVQQRSGLPIAPYARFRRPTNRGGRIRPHVERFRHAVGRTLIVIMENWQDGDGAAHVPDVLRPYVGGAMRRASSLTSAQSPAPCLPPARVLRRHVAK